jgi:putative ATP-dependent endonuclease of the OLD family
MRIKALRIQNFRSFEDETIDFGPYSCFVGPNGAGKSTVLVALNTFFRETTNPTDVTLLREEDFHLRDTSKPIVITVTFCDLPPDAKEDLRGYVRHRQLVVSAKATWDDDARGAEVKQVGSRLVMQDFAEFFSAKKVGARVGELRILYRQLRERFPDLPAINTKQGMEDALRRYEEAHEELCTPHESSDQFYGWSRGANRLGGYCQWVFVPAVKHASEEEHETRASALGQLLQRTIRSKVDFSADMRELREAVAVRYSEIIAAQQGLLGSLSSSLQGRLQDWAHPGAKVELKWHLEEGKSVAINDPLAKITVGEGPFSGELSRLGHGFQRSFIISLLQELAAADASRQPRLILAVEEPELYQHPPQALHLSDVLQHLAEKGAQVMVTTHSPYFVTGRGFESVRLTRKDAQSGATQVSSLTHERLSEILAEALDTQPEAPSNMMSAVEQIMQPSQNELFFSRVPILVEGIEDVAFISSYLHLTGRWRVFRRCGCHFVVCGGKNAMSRPLAIAVGLKLQPFVVFDGDGDREQEVVPQRRDNGCLLRLCGEGDSETFPQETLWSARLVMWHTRLLDQVRVDVGPERWREAQTAASDKLGFSRAPSKKSGLWIATTIERLYSKGIRSTVLERLCRLILDHGERVASTYGGS